VVTNPSAKYDPDGMSGIINIVLKKNKLRGFNGNVDVTYGTGNSHTTSAGVNLRNNKFNVFANYGYNYSDGFRNFFSERERQLGSENELLLQERFGSDHRSGHTGKAGIDYTLKEGHVIGTSITGSYNNRNRDGLLTNTLYLDNSETALWQRNAAEPRTSQSLDLNLNYQWRFKEKRGEVMADFTQSWGKGEVLGFYDEYDLMDYLNSPSVMERLDNPNDRSVFTGMVDIIRNFKSSIRLETGAKAIINADDRTQYREVYDFDTEQFVPDVGINNQFKLTEQIYAAYGIFGHQVKQFKYQLGLRAEQALVRPELITTGQSFKNDYFSLFPSAHFAYELKKKGELFLSYSRRINRPSARSLNPFTEYSDPFNLRMGNPALKPEYINSFELGYNKTWKTLTLNTTGYYRYSTDVIQRIRTFYPDGTGATTYENLDNTINFGFEGIVIYRPYSWWRNNFSTNIYQTILMTSNPELQNNSGLNWGFKLTSAVDFWKKTTTLQLNYRYNAPRIVPQGIVQFKPAIDVSIQRSFFDKKLALTLRVSDIFDWQGFYMLVDSGNTRQESTYKWQSRRLFITLSYKFGKLEMGNDQRRRRGDGAGGSGGDMDF
jgi:outer membrane receptor protein involved in Fe transport